MPEIRLSAPKFKVFVPLKPVEVEEGRRSDAMSDLGDEMLAGMEAFLAVLESGKPIESRFTVRSIQEPRPMPEIILSAKKLKVFVPLDPAALPPVPLEGPIGDLTLLIDLEGTTFVVPARVNGKSYRRTFKAVKEKGAANVVVVLQGELMATSEGGLRLDSAGFQVQDKTPKGETTANS